ADFGLDRRFFLVAWIGSQDSVALEIGEQYIPDDIDRRAERLRCALLHHGPTSEEAAPLLEETRALARAHPENTRLKQILVALDR
ncbi:MAG: hypothetical protein ACE5MH_09185, partial [Terriglobia bacterium]